MRVIDVAELKENTEEKPNIPEEILGHIAWLEQAIAKELANFKVALAEYTSVQRRLQRFLKDYYQEVGRYFWDLERLEGGLSENELQQVGTSLLVQENKTLMGVGEHSKSIYVQRDVIRKQQAKQLFRKLAKRCHPDISEIPDANTVFSEVSQAYAASDLCKLIMLEQNLLEAELHPRETAVQRLERLEAKYRVVLREKDDLLIKKHRLKQSPEFKLWQQVFREKARGHDLVSEIKSNVIQEVQTKRRMLARKARAKSTLEQEQQPVPA